MRFAPAPARPIGEYATSSGLDIPGVSLIGSGMRR